jgi:hypothetical protein
LTTERQTFGWPRAAARSLIWRRAVRGPVVTHWRALHHHKAGQPKIVHQPLRRDFGHKAVGVVGPLASVKLQGESQGLGQLLSIGRPELVHLFGHVGRVAGRSEQVKNKRGKAP